MTAVAVSLRDAPIEAQVDAAVRLIALGEINPYDALYALVMAEETMIFDVQPTVADVFQCGHPKSDENSHIKGDGWRRCLECKQKGDRERARTRRRRQRAKAPCVICGAPCTAPNEKGKGGLPYARCQACYFKQKREDKAWKEKCGPKLVKKSQKGLTNPKKKGKVPA